MSYWHLFFPENNTVWESHFAPISSARAWLDNNTLTENAPFLDKSHEADWLSWMARPNAIEAGLNCYRAQHLGVNDADEASLTKEDWMLHVPVLAIGGTLDPVARADFMEATRPWAAVGFESELLHGGHWLMMELPDAVSKLLIRFGQP